MDGTLGKRAIHMVSAWASDNRLVLVQQKVDEKSNEITAIPALLEMLEIAGCIVTIDAMGCQTEIAQKIVDQQGDYVLAVKANQGHLYEDIEHWCQLYPRHEQPMFYFNDYAKTVDKAYDRIEIRSSSQYGEKGKTSDAECTAGNLAKQPTRVFQLSSDQENSYLKKQKKAVRGNLRSRFDLARKPAVVIRYPVRDL